MNKRPKKSAVSSGKATGAASSATTSSLSPGRKCLFRFILLVLLPVILLGSVEGGLRLAGYGKSYRLFKKVSDKSGDYFINDDLFSSKFFPPEMTRSTSAFKMNLKKDGYRIFVLGESAAMGDPEPAFGASRYLEVLLREKYPGVKFEIVNLGITAINSHVIVPIARECAQHEGDLWIIYMGNNEMVGPFGAATVFGAQALPVELVRLSLFIKGTRIGQLLQSVAARLKPSKSAGQAWGGMEMFVENKIAPDDPRRAVVYRNFTKNLETILDVGTHSGAKVLLSTVAVNLRDCPPFASFALTNLSASDAARCREALDRTAAANSDATAAQVVRELESVASLAPKSADIKYALAQILARTGQVKEGIAHYQKACDLDMLPFRSDTPINSTITKVSANFLPEQVQLVDAATSMAAQTPTGVSGQESFYEHVHLNFDGNYRLARVWAEQIEKMLPPTISKGAKAQWVDQTLCERRLGLSDWNRYYIMDSVLNRFYGAPLNSQANNTERIETFRKDLQAIAARMNSNNIPAARALLKESVAWSPDDYYLHDNYAMFLTVLKEYPEALVERKKVRELVPHDFASNFQLAKLLRQSGNLTDAEPMLYDALSSHPGFSEALIELADLHAAQGKLPESAGEYERAEKLRPTDATIPNHLGMVYSRMKRSEDALKSFRQAIEIRPEYWEAHYTLGGELGTHEQFQQAAEQFQMVTQLEPKFSGGHLNLGVALLKLGRLDESAKEFEAVLALDPQDKTARLYLDKAREMMHR